MVKAVKVEDRLITLSKVKTPDEEHYSKIRDFLLESYAVYPSIGEWWKTRVVPGLKSGERLCQAIITNGEIAALSIVKHSRKSSKLCTLRVRESYRSLGFGQRLLQLAFTRLLSKRCQNVHYTISDEVLGDCSDFFAPYGFHLDSWKKDRYVRGTEELIFSVKAQKLLDKLGTLNRNQVTNKKVILISIKPEFADLIEQGHKRVEFRRKFGVASNSAQVCFYVTSPVREIRLTANISSVIKSDPSKLWSRFKEHSGIGHEAFRSYFEGASEGVALLLSNVQSLEQPIDLRALKQHDSSFSPPQSYRILRSDEPLYRLIPHVIRDKAGA